MTDRGDSVWDRWEVVDQLLERVLDQPEGKREQFLARECAHDPELARTVAALARISSTAEDAPLGPGSGILQAMLSEHPDGADDDAEALVGTTVGSYRLTGLLGSGGMGTVFSAERADDAYEKDVAVKLLRQSVNTPVVAERFRQERQILASLSHPGIAQMLDGGVTDDGRPFLVMERVDGAPIDVYADEHELGVEERVQLVLSVAAAVEYAHRHMVVHRDLKPSNILVRDDGAVKLLDFGIAKLLEKPGGDGETVTRAEARFVTPEYAAPEQILGEPVSAQTDVYALTALLYELLTGVRPYQRGAGGSVLERVVEGAEPTAPSAAIPRGGVSSEGGVQASSLEVSNVFAARSTTPDALRRRLSGDLDAILVRGLRARPAERYASVQALRDDLQRHLAGEAVTARGEAFAYRASKFVSRHRVPLAVAAGVFLLTAGSAAGLAVQRGDLIEERNRAEAATTLADQEAETARQVTAFLVDLFEGSDPSERLGDTITARALLERGTERIDQELSDRPSVRAELLGVLGEVYANLGDHERAVALLTRAATLHRDSLVGQAGLSRALRSLGAEQSHEREYTKARTALVEAVATAASLGDSLELAYARLALGEILKFLEMPDSAETQLRAGLELLNRFAPENTEGYLIATVNLGGVLRRRGDLAGADSLYARVVTRRRGLADQNPLNFGSALNDLAVVRRMQGQLESAETLYRESADTFDAVLGSGHPRSVGIRVNLITTLVEHEKWEAALFESEGALAAVRGTWPDGHWRVGLRLMEYGGLLVQADRPEEALTPLQEAVDVMIEQLGAFHSWTEISRAWLGLATALTGDPERAEQLFSWTITGLSSYEALPQDLTVKNMLSFVIQVAEDKGLEEVASRLGGITDLSGRP